MNVKVILVCQEEGEARQAYIGAVKPLGVQVDIVPSLSKLHKLLSENFYNGVMVGRDLQIPGIGVKFENISAGQLTEICNIGHIS